jgi:hypothetical protein
MKRSFNAAAMLEEVEELFEREDLLGAWRSLHAGGRWPQDDPDV